MVKKFKFTDEEKRIAHDALAHIPIPPTGAIAGVMDWVAENLGERIRARLLYERDEGILYATSTSGTVCPAIITIKGEWYPCDQEHRHVTHGNALAGAIWTEDRAWV